jgi:Flp pilus assembly protein TadB
MSKLVLYIARQQECILFLPSNNSCDAVEAAQLQRKKKAKKEKKLKRKISSVSKKEIKATATISAKKRKNGTVKTEVAGLVMPVTVAAMQSTCCGLLIPSLMAICQPPWDSGGRRVHSVQLPVAAVLLHVMNFFFFAHCFFVVFSH